MHPCRILLDRIAAAAMCEHTLRREMLIVAKCILLGTAVGSLFGLLIGSTS